MFPKAILNRTHSFILSALLFYYILRYVQSLTVFLILLSQNFMLSASIWTGCFLGPLQRGNLGPNRIAIVCVSHCFLHLIFSLIMVGYVLEHLPKEKVHGREHFLIILCWINLLFYSPLKWKFECKPLNWKSFPLRPPEALVHFYYSLALVHFYYSLYLLLIIREVVFLFK